MKKMFRIIAAFLMSFVLTAGIIPSGLPFGIREAFAEGENLYLGASVLAQKVNTEDAATVRFGNGGEYAWRVVGYNGESPSIPLSEGGEGKITLLADETIPPKTCFDDDNAENSHRANNEYKDSLLMKKTNEIADNISAEEKAAVVLRTLENSGYNDGIAGEKVDDQVLWPLSEREAGALDESIRVVHNEDEGNFAYYYWLRSPDKNTAYIGTIINNSKIPSPYCFHGYVYIAYGVRPALNLARSSVVFTSLVKGTPGNKGAEYKLTVLDSKMNLSVDEGYGLLRGSKVRISYKIDGDNKGKVKKLTAIMTDGEWGDSFGWSTGAPVKYCCRLDALGGIGETGTATFTLPDEYKKDWRTYIVAETENGGNSTDFAGKPVEIELVNDKTVDGLGTGSIKNPMDTGKWDYVYFGGKTENKYRVLSVKTNDFSEDKTKYSMLLDSDEVMKDHDGHVLKMKFDGDSNLWNDSDIKGALNGDSFLNDGFYFTVPERNSLAESKKAGPSSSDGDGSEKCSFVSLTGEKIFFLDAREVTNPTYGYDNNQDVENWEIASRKKGGDYWLRSNVGDSVYVETVLGSGALASTGYGFDNSNPHVCPAFNLDPSSVLFTSLLSGSPDKPGAEYKLTLLHNGMKISLPDEDKVKVSGNTCDFTAMITNDAANGVEANGISVLVTDKEFGNADARILGYSFVNETSASGSVHKGSFTLDPYKLSGNVGKDIFIYLIAEMVNGEKETDYASEPLKIDSFNGAHFHRFSYSVKGRSIIAECTVEDCTLPDNKISLNLRAPALKTEGGTGSPSASLSGAEDFCRETGLSVQESDIRYEGTGSTAYPESSEAPTKAGSYCASITVNGLKAYVDYTINSKEEKKDPDDPSDPDKPDPTPTPTPKEEALEAMKNTLAATGDTIMLTKRGKKYGLKTDVSGTLTVVKGNKFVLFDIDGKPVFIKNKAVKISKKGKVQAKKEISDYRFSYKDKVNGKNISVSLNVINPSITGGKKLTASTVAGTDFDFSTTIPLNAEFLKVKNKGVAENLTYQGETALGDDGKLHIKGKALKKGTVKIPFKVYGKKFTVKLKVKKPSS